MSPRIIDGIGELVPNYDGFILDIWGVLHDGSKPFPGVIEALEKLKAAGKRTVVLSNAPRRAEMVASRLAEIGVPRALYDQVHSSGEEAWGHLSRRDDPFFSALGRRVYFIGPARDDPMLQGLDYQRVSDVGQADFLLGIGPADWEEDVGPYEAMLKSARARDLPMVCANADLVVMHKGRRSICAGAIAQRYEELGGTVRWHGKPFGSVYRTCFELLGGMEKRRILAVGDSLRTDIAGAASAGIDSVLVAGGIHAEELGVSAGGNVDTARLEHALASAGAKPIAAMAHFRW
jgi:HAD superfamily hydrolase (TIGR01459 family)